jgi:hypothetical protein
VAKSIHRPLYATALSFQANKDESPCVIVSIDYGWFTDYKTGDILRKPILEMLGIKEHQFLLIVSHSHSIPHIDEEEGDAEGSAKIQRFRESVMGAIEGAVLEAVEKSQPAILSWGKSTCTLARSRSYFDPDSKRILCGPNPFGIVDQTVLIGRVTQESTEKILATIVNYACHPVSLGGGNTSVSPDYIGAMRAVIEDNTEGAPCAFLHGPSGNQTPRDCYSSDVRVADNNGEILGFAALSGLRALLPPGQQFEFAGVQDSGAPLALWETQAFNVDRSIGSAVEYVQLPKKSFPSLAEVDEQIKSAKDRAEWTRMSRLRRSLINLEQGLSRGFPDRCRNQSGIVVTCCDKLSTSVSSFSINNSYLQTPERLREAGAGGSNPLTPTRLRSSFQCFSWVGNRHWSSNTLFFCRNRFRQMRQFPGCRAVTVCAVSIFAGRALPVTTQCSFLMSLRREQRS